MSIGIRLPSLTGKGLQLCAQYAIGRTCDG